MRKEWSKRAPKKKACTSVSWVSAPRATRTKIDSGTGTPETEREREIKKKKRGTGNIKTSISTEQLK